MSKPMWRVIVPTVSEELANQIQAMLSVQHGLRSIVSYVQVDSDDADGDSSKESK